MNLVSFRDLDAFLSCLHSLLRSFPGIGNVQSHRSCSTAQTHLVDPPLVDQQVS